MANDSSALGAIEIATQGLGRAGWHSGRVLARKGQQLSVRVGARCVDALRAEGCILMPEADDEVAVLETAEACYVMQVLLRRGDAPRVWDAGQAVSLNAEQISVNASRLNACVEDVSWLSQRIRLTASELVANSKLLRWAGHCVEAVAERLQVSAKRSYRHISEVDQIRAGLFDLKAQNTAQIQARQLLMKGRDLTKVDGAQIHVG